MLVWKLSRNFKVYLTSRNFKVYLTLRNFKVYLTLYYTIYCTLLALLKAESDHYI